MLHACPFRHDDQKCFDIHWYFSFNIIVKVKLKAGFNFCSYFWASQPIRAESQGNKEQGWVQEKKKKPEVKILLLLGDICWRKYNIFHPQKTLNWG